MSCVSWLFQELNWSGVLILYKVPLRNLDLWFVLWSFISINLPFDLGWDSIVTGAWNRYLDILYKQHRMICRGVAPTFAFSLEPLAYFWNTASILYRCYFGRCSSGLVKLVSHPYYHGRSTYYIDELHDFTVTVSRCFRDVNVNTFFPHTARLWNDFQQNGFPWLMISVDLTLDLIVTFYLWVCFLINLLTEFSSLTFFVVPCLVKAFLACAEWTPN